MVMMRYFAYVYAVYAAAAAWVPKTDALGRDSVSHGRINQKKKKEREKQEEWLPSSHD